MLRGLLKVTVGVKGQGQGIRPVGINFGIIGVVARGVGSAKAAPLTADRP
jgi:hypothetical protein